MAQDFKVLTILRLGGDYKEKHVEWLQKQISLPIICLTDSKIPMTNVTSIPLAHNWQGWWSKLEMFRPDLDIGNFLYTDLDTVFLQGIPEEYKQLKNTVVLADISRTPRDRMNSGLMFIHEKSKRDIWKGFVGNPESIMSSYRAGGDQAYLNGFLHHAKKWQTLFPGHVVSYKTHVHREGFKGTEKIVVFHGKPRPWEVVERWIPKL